MKHKLWHFNGGLHLDGHKHMSMTEHVLPVALPAQITLPLQQHIGAPAEPVVAVGDHVPLCMPPLPVKSLRSKNVQCPTLRACLPSAS